jgi:hypothetical protein
VTTDAKRISLRPPVANLEWYRGATVPFTVTGTYENGSAVNLTGASIKMQLRDSSGTVALTLQTGGSGIVITTPASGIFTISPEAVGTGSLSLDIVYSYDIKVTLADTTVTPWTRGTVTLIDKTTS